MLRELTTNFSGYEPRRISGRALRKIRGEAAVLVAVTDEDVPKVILTERAGKLRTHSGEVAFPGGKREEDDTTLLFTALRETEEEIGLAPDSVRVVCELNQVMSLHGLIVTPWLGVVSPDVELQPNPHELDTVFSVSLDYLLNPKYRGYDQLDFHGQTRFVPAWNFEGKTIWGLTAYILAEMLNTGLAASIPLLERPEHSHQG